MKKGWKCRTMGWMFDLFKEKKTSITQIKGSKIRTKVNATEWSRRGDSGAPLICYFGSMDLLVGILSQVEHTGH